MTKNPNTAILAAGCFWGVEQLVRSLPGVIDTEVGYIQSAEADRQLPQGAVAPTYSQVKTGQTEYAEAIRIVFDAQQISYDQILDHFFRLHNPTTVDRQENDVGRQYRSAIFYSSEAQNAAAHQAIERAQKSGRWSKPLVTLVEEAGYFHVAEAYHQDYLQKNPDGYNCHYWRS